MDRKEGVFILSSVREKWIIGKNACNGGSQVSCGRRGFETADRRFGIKKQLKIKY